MVDLLVEEVVAAVDAVAVDGEQDRDAVSGAGGDLSGVPWPQSWLPRSCWPSSPPACRPAGSLAALAWLALIAVPLAFIGIAVQRLPDLLTISAFAGTFVLLAAEGAAHQPWLLVRAVIGGAALAGFYRALWLIFPDQLGLGDVKLAASIGLVLAWGSWSELFAGALAGALLGAAYARVLSARHGPAGPV
jgi:prepilin signal peptidase PulO-like enzyme (type II secretory pathway)